MHSVTLLQTITKKSCPFVHKKRLDCLFDVVTSLTQCGQLWISALGRNVRNQTTEKHNIKKVDTLVGNLKLHEERQVYYTMIAHQLIGNKKHPEIIVDWSPVSATLEHYILRASVTGKGRAFTIYEEIHPLESYANDKVHRKFLDTLSGILPNGCCPIVVTDAGFRNPWFEKIMALSWYFIGRLRHNTYVKLEAENNWQPVTSLHSRATLTPRYLGKVLVAKSRPLEMNMYQVKEEKKNRVKKTKQGKKCQSSNSKKYAKSAQEPWVLITSLPHRFSSSKKIIKLYKFRMQIEEAFRDLKEKRYGFRFPESGTKDIKRLENLLLIALLATLAAWLTGVVAINRKWHYQLQANTVRNKPVLSIFFIGLHVLRSSRLPKLTIDELLRATMLLGESVIDGDLL